MIRLFERGYMKVLPDRRDRDGALGAVAAVDPLGGLQPSYMGSTIGMALSTGGALAIIALLIGIDRHASRRRAHLRDREDSCRKCAMNHAKKALLAEMDECARAPAWRARSSSDSSSVRSR